MKKKKSYDMYFQRDFLKSKIEQNAVFGPKYLENGKEWRDQIFYPCRTIARGRKNGEKIFQENQTKCKKIQEKLKKLLKNTLKVKFEGQVSRSRC